MRENLLSPWLTTTLDPPAACRGTIRLKWESRDQKRRLVIQDTPQSRPWLDLGDFSSALRTSALFDNTAVNLPGAVVALPDGHRLVLQFCRIVRRHYEAAGLTEYDYPALAPLDAFDTFCEVFDAKERALYVGTRQDFRSNDPRAVLLPTGEPAIYAHWKQLVREQADLPIEMFQQSRFYRPWSSSRRGRHIFNTLEGADTFEFHCCYPPAMAQERAEHLFGMLRGLTKALAVPVIWSTRPPWSNHSAVSVATVGGDCPLPSGASLQVGTIYRQDTKFSSRFGIQYRAQDGSRITPAHVVGALSRRILLTHLCLGMIEGGGFAVHPLLAATQVQIVIRQTDFESGESIAAQIAPHVQSSNLMTTTTTVSSAGDATRQLKRAALSPAPLTFLLQGRRHEHDRALFVLRRADDFSEVRGDCGTFHELPANLLADATQDVADAHACRGADYLQRRVVEAATMAHVREVLTARLVALCPMEFSAAAGETVSSWKQGEILGFVGNSEARPCVLSGRACTTLAYISPRA